MPDLGISDLIDTLSDDVSQAASGAQAGPNIAAEQETYYIVTGRTASEMVVAPVQGEILTRLVPLSVYVFSLLHHGCEILRTESLIHTCYPLLFLCSERLLKLAGQMGGQTTITVG